MSTWQFRIRGIVSGRVVFDSRVDSTREAREEVEELQLEFPTAEVWVTTRNGRDANLV